MRRRDFLSTTALTVAAAAQPAASKKPNFIVILADDLGYGDLGCYGSSAIRTPRIDQMAREGTRLTSFYAQPICGPSRTALLTGCYPMRVAERGNVKNLHPIVHEKEVMISQLLKQAGYSCAMIGKWDQAGHSNNGYQKDLMPLRRGFDTYFGTPMSNDFPKRTPLLRNDDLVEEATDLATLTRRYTDETIRFIREHSDQPFFVYLCPNMPHTVLAASDEFRGRSPRGLYGDVVEELDYNTGRIFDTLRELKLDQNTYVLFTSDNGPWLIRKQDGGSAGPLRSGKVSTWEGGLRVPAIWWAPGKIPAGRVCDEILATLDILPTFATIAGISPPRDRVIDGVDITAVLHGRKVAQTSRQAFFYYLWTHLQAVRSGKWKLHLPRTARPPWLGKLVQVPHIHEQDVIEIPEPMLFDLEADIGETTDIATKHPDVVRQLLSLAERAREDIGDHDRTGRAMRFFDVIPTAAAGG